MSSGCVGHYFCLAVSEFQFAISQGPHVVVQFIAPKIIFLLTLFK
jgi:hypothetical protein